MAHTPDPSLALDSSSVDSQDGPSMAYEYPSPPYDTPDWSGFTYPYFGFAPPCSGFAPFSGFVPPQYSGCAPPMTNTTPSMPSTEVLSRRRRRNNPPRRRAQRIRPVCAVTPVSMQNIQVGHLNQYAYCSVPWAPFANPNHGWYGNVQPPPTSHPVQFGETAVGFDETAGTFGDAISINCGNPDPNNMVFEETLGPDNMAQPTETAGLDNMVQPTETDLGNLAQPTANTNPGNEPETAVGLGLGNSVLESQYIWNPATSLSLSAGVSDTQPTSAYPVDVPSSMPTPDLSDVSSMTSLSSCPTPTFSFNPQTPSVDLSSPSIDLSSPSFDLSSPSFDLCSSSFDLPPLDLLPSSEIQNSPKTSPETPSKILEFSSPQPNVSTAYLLTKRRARNPGRRIVREQTPDRVRKNAQRRERYRSSLTPENRARYDFNTAMAKGMI